MDLAVIVLVEFLYAIASLALIGAGLAVVFGMIGVINLAHGEFMVIGGYAAIVAVNAGVNIYIAMLVAAPLVAGIVGLIAERLVIRFLYGRMVDTMLASWGLSLIIIGCITAIFGNTTTGISTPISGFRLGAYQVNGYNFFIIVVAVLLMAAGYAALKWTRMGLIARGTMQRADMAAALGYNADRVYMITFCLGTAVSGLAGGILAPLVGLVPKAGAAYITKAFITVIAGGPAPIAGLVSSATLFGIVNQAFTFAYAPVVGEVALLIVAVLLLRFLPQGITGGAGRALRRRP